MAYLTPSAFLDRYDVRTISQRMLDDGTDATVADLIDTGNDAGRRLQAAIDDAEGLLIAAAGVGTRYRVEDFDLLFADKPTSASANAIRRLIADLAFGIILKRRSLPAAEFNQLAPAYAEAVAFLDLIRSGERVFPDIAGVAEAGLPATESNVPRVGLDQPLLWSQQTKLFGVLDFPPN